MLNTKNNNDAKEFIRLALYNEEKRENYTETRIRLNESQETSHLCQFHRIHICYSIQQKNPFTWNRWIKITKSIIFEKKNGWTWYPDNEICRQ